MQCERHSADQADRATQASTGGQAEGGEGHIGISLETCRPVASRGKTGESKTWTSLAKSNRPPDVHKSFMHIRTSFCHYLPISIRHVNNADDLQLHLTHSCINLPIKVRGFSSPPRSRLGDCWEDVPKFRIIIDL